MKAGNRLTNATITTAQDGKPSVIGLAVVGHNPVDVSFSDLPRPEAPSPDEAVERGESHHPYVAQYEMRPTMGSAPWRGSPSSTVGGWIRMRAPRALDVPLVAALTDTWMPSFWPRLSEPAGKITVDLTIHLRSTLVPRDVGYWFIRQVARHCERGFVDEDCEIWDSSGRLVATSRQLILLSR